MNICAAISVNVTDTYINIPNFNPQVSVEITVLAAFSGSLAHQEKKTE